MKTLAALFGAQGKLAATLDGFQPRPQQLELAEAVGAALANQRTLIAEAGTGTGKTLAYLAPAVLSGQRILISTGTRNLQDQLFDKDIPLLRGALDLPIQAALLKGRANYLCPHRLANAEPLAWEERHGAYVHEREIIRAWAGRTQTGDTAEVSSVAESSPIWAEVTSTTDNCLGQDCPDITRCFLLKARRKAQESRLVVINHHLLCAEWRLRQEGFGELLADADAIVVDEAHQLAEIASQFLGQSLSARRLVELARDAAHEQARDAPDVPALGDLARALETAARNLRHAFAPSPRRHPWADVADRPELGAGLDALAVAIDRLAKALEAAAPRGKGLEACWKRALELGTQLVSVRDDAGGAWVRWVETYRTGYSLNRTPLNISDDFRRFMAAFGGAWVFLSATLSVDGRFEHFIHALGIEGAETHNWESPFDYPGQSLCYLPTGLPEPSTPDYTRTALEAALPVLAASRGRAFLLFTSHQALGEAARFLDGRTNFPLFIQGQKPKPALLHEFRASGNGILLGTASFWEGVDVRGEALSCVIIDKLPFASPTDPVFRARLDALRAQGGDPFTDMQIPAAVIAIKQGAGRLIRDATDRGVLMLCDPRLLSKRYGRLFLDSLPPMPRTRALRDVEAFFATPSQGGG